MGNPLKVSGRKYVKREFLVQKMIKDGINIYLLQETWDEKDYAMDVGHGYIMFNHNTCIKKDRTGVGIIISPRLSRAWKEAGGISRPNSHHREIRRQIYCHPSENAIT